uniref:Uncharacterized protein n=1 Tax=Schizophyllum commune (strain H4-8 / FGSC 9210) TaxID=578458 RepID=D8PZY8_SCHCM
MVLRLLPSNDISQGDLITLLRKAQMATLTELELLRGPVASDALFTQLDPEYGPPLLPRVQRLTLAECNTTDGAIGNMLASRCRLGYPLRMLRIRTHLDEMDRYHKDKRMFQSLEEQYGMRVDYPGSRAWLEALKATSAARRKGRFRDPSHWHPLNACSNAWARLSLYHVSLKTIYIVPAAPLLDTCLSNREKLSSSAHRADWAGVAYAK